MVEKAFIKDNKRIFYVEILRIIAIFFVIYNHTGDDGFKFFNTLASGTAAYWVCMFFSIITRVNVPLFLMISGMLLLGKDEPLSYILKKRIPKYVIALILISLFVYFRNTGYDIHKFSAIEFIKKLYTGGIATPYWYIYLYIGFLIALPFLRAMAKELTEKNMIYLVILQLLFNGILVIFQFIASKGSGEYEYHINPAVITADVVFYPLAGFYIGNKVRKIKGKTVLILGGVSLAAVAISMLMTDYKLRILGENAGDPTKPFFDVLRVLTAIFVFVLVRFIFEDRKISVPVQKVICNLGSCVFLIYLIEEIPKVDLWFIFEAMKTKIGGFAAIWIYVLIVLAVSWAVTSPVVIIWNLIKRSRKSCSSL